MSRQIVRLSGVTFTEVGLPVLDVTDEEIALASLPGLVMWFDPQEQFRRPAPPVGMHDRVKPWAMKAFDNTPVDLGAAINGQPTMGFLKANTDGLTVQGQALHGVGSYTKIMVINAPLGGTGNMTLMGAESAIVQLLLNHDGSLRVVHGATTLISTAGAVSAGTDHIVACCYDADAEIAHVYVDGVEISLSSAGVISPPAASVDLSIGVTVGVGQFLTADVGYCFFFDAPYSRVAYQSHFDSIHTILSAKYGIALG